MLSSVCTTVTFFHILLLILSNALAKNVVLETALGTIEGRQLTTLNGTTFYAFTGIPYAKPPVGSLRFQAPQPAEKWNGTLDATKDPNYCYQVKTDSNLETEDCLYINVFVPVGSKYFNDNLPVMFWIYGGAFRSGYSRYGTGGPEWILEQGIVFVNFNYRVGPFGFLATGDNVVSGNAGLKDQQLALKWTYDNIASFRGDPKKITISGQSAGAASVGFHLLSKNSAGLFRAAIAESGSPLNTWAYRSNPKALTITLARTIDSSISSSESSNNLLSFLQNVDAKSIDNASTKISLFLPVVEPEHNKAFITQDFYEALVSGKNVNKVPFLIGFNSEEDITAGADLASLQKSGASYDQNHDKLIPSSMNVNATYKKVVGNDIASLYGHNTTFEDMPGYLIRWMSDNTFIRSVIKHAKIHASYNKVYLYKFTYDGPMGNINITVEGAEKVGHGEETKYLFVTRGSTYDNTKDENFPASDIITRQRAISLWTNFVKYMDPTPEKTVLLQNITWPVVDPNNFQFLNFGENLRIDTNPQKQYYIYWEELFNKYGVQPFVCY